MDRNNDKKDRTMPINAIKKAILAAAAALPALLAAPNSAHATVSANNPFSEAATGKLANFVDGHWVAWLPKSDPANCSKLVWQYVGPVGGLTDNVNLVGGANNDSLEEAVSGSVCGWAMSPPVHNGWAVYIFGGAGNDYLLGRDSLTYLYGQDGNDALWSYTNVKFFWGQAGNDFLMGCAFSNSTEQYMGGDGTDYVNDISGTWSLKADVEGNAGGC
jgi:Ca2+-binding RTX toxin-like protein